MAPRWACLLFAITVVAAAASPVEAAVPRLGVGDVHSEADVADEAGAVTLLVDSALEGNDVVLAAPPAGLTLESRDQIGAANLSHAVLMELSREGTGLRLTLAILGADGSRDIAYLRAGDGDVVTLAQGVIDHVISECKLEGRHAVPPVGLGALRPYAAALRARSTPAEAASALADALPRTSLTVSAAGALLGGVSTSATDPVQAILAARALRDGKRLAQIASANTGVVAAAANALAAMATGNQKVATEALGPKPERHGLVQLAQVVIAENGSDKAALEAKIKDALVGDQVRPVLAIAASMEPGTLSPALHKALITAAEKNRAPGVAARIGLNAAEAGVEIERALALVSARELDTFDLTRLDTLVAKRTDKTSLRLRAELSMRRADGLESGAINAFLGAAPDDLLAHRYRGWSFVADGKYTEAATELGKAGAKLERARAFLAAGDPRAALTALGGPPRSPEELVIAAHVAILDKNADEAAKTLALAATQSPVNPIVHRAIVALDAVKPDPARVAISKAMLGADAGKGAAVTTTSVGSGGSADGSATAKVDLIQVTASIDPSEIEPLLTALPRLLQLKKHTLVLAQVKWEPSWYSFKTTNPELVEGALLKTLQAPPYGLKIRREPVKQPDETPTAARLTDLTADVDAVLLYRVSVDDGGARVSLSFFVRDGNDLASVTRVVKASGVVELNKNKLYTVLAFAGVLLAGLLVYVLRAKGRIKLKLIKAPDVSDEVVCVEISKSPTRPRIADPTKFHKETKAAGVVTKPTSATLIVSGQTFKVGVGQWYVHVYGTFVRSGKLLVVPSSCTHEVVLARGDLAELDFELTSKLAEVRVEVIANPRRGTAVWVASAAHEKQYTDDDGVALLMLPLGTHKVVIEARGQRFERDVQIAALKQQVLSINVERELLLGQGVALDLGGDSVPPVIVEPQPERPRSKPATRAPSPLASANTDFSPQLSAPQAAPPSRPTPAPRPTPLPEATALAASGAAMASPRAHPRARTPLPGETLLGRYRITAELGRGAMGVVHRARDEKLERDVAIKEMADDLRSNPEAMRLFEQEAKALAQLNHTNIVAMYDQVTDVAGVYMIMEFVDGKPLASLIEQRGALPWRDAVAIVDQVLSGLAYAHARKVIHRDIKPANIFIAADRTVKLGDFGLARVMREVTIRRTEIRGTPLYMAPEQITGTNVDHRADLYATGCMLFELVTGRPPFIDGDILYAQMHQPPPSAASMVEIPRALDELILSLLAKSADDRPGSANEVRAALKGVHG